jgi:hypothetical protein
MIICKPIAFFVACALARAESLSVCEALANLTLLNGKAVEVEGVWRKGDSGQQIWATSPCPRPTIRDGWQFVDAIKVTPDGSNESVAEYYRQLRGFARTHPGTKIVATLSGRLEAPDHFETWTDPLGALHLRAFGSLAARLRFSSADGFRSISVSAEEVAREAEVLRNPQPRRVKY